jgi:hypothetical protein
MKRVVIESPYAGENSGITERNIRYARACMHDALSRGEAPFASHLLYAQPGLLHDAIEEERLLGIEVGLVWAMSADLTAVYTDLGLSQGMKLGIRAAENCNRPVEYRQVDGWQDLV